MATSFKPTVSTDATGKFYDNALRFATKEEAERSARDLMNRWMLVRDCRAEESDDPVNYRLDDEGHLIPVDAEQGSTT